MRRVDSLPRQTRHPTLTGPTLAVHNETARDETAGHSPEIVSPQY
jgi:hypothetical protein